MTQASRLWGKLCSGGWIGAKTEKDGQATVSSHRDVVRTNCSGTVMGGDRGETGEDASHRRAAHAADRCGMVGASGEE